MIEDEDDIWDAVSESFTGLTIAEQQAWLQANLPAAELADCKLNDRADRYRVFLRNEEALVRPRFAAWVLTQPDDLTREEVLALVTGQN